MTPDQGPPVPVHPEPGPGSGQGRDRRRDSKVGSTSDYFAAGRDGTTFNQLPGMSGWSAAARPGVLQERDRRPPRRPALRVNLETRTTFAAVADGTSNTILFGECAGREDVWRGRELAPADADKAGPNCAAPAAGRGPPTTTRTRSASGSRGAPRAPAPDAAAAVPRRR